ncbi:MAG TPA: peptide deformylase [Thermoanaerobaculia bacterium]
MAVLKVAKLGASVLRGRSSEIETHDLKKGRLRSFFEDMTETMAEYNGTGLAAPQVATPLRVVLYEVHAQRRGGLVVPLTFLVNPSFEVLDGAEEEDFEACLSVPFLAAKVPRPKKIRVRALDLHGKPLDFVAEDFHARVVLHETDHLDGVVYLDRVRDRASIRYTIDF